MCASIALSCPASIRNGDRYPSGLADGWRRRAADERGAVMVLGLFLALGVVAALWCVIGVGDAIIARDRSQEAADSVAYASAVLHARGMNFIALINIVIMAMTLIYVVFSSIDVLLSSLLMVTGITEPSPNWCGLKYVSWLVGTTVNWCPVARAVESVEVPLYRLDHAYFDRYKKIATPLYHAQSWAGTGVPYLALAAGAVAGSEYNHLGLAYSHSLWPGGGAPANINFVRPLMNKVPFAVRKIEGRDVNLARDRRIGLPIDSEAAFALCVRGTRFIFEWLNTLPATESFGGKTWKEWSSTEPLSSVSAFLFQAAGETVRYFFCRDKDPVLSETVQRAGVEVTVLTLRGTFAAGLLGIPAGANDKFYLKGDSYWRMQADSGKRYADGDSEFYVGPKRTVDYAYNGNDWMQTWAAVKSLDDVGNAAENVNVPARVFGRGEDGAALPDPASGWLFAEAEFYLDCPSPWTSFECNRGSAAMYRMNWRARLRRMHWPNAANTAFEMFLDNFITGPGSKFLTNKAFAKLATPAREAIFDTLSKDLLKLANQKLFTEDTSIDGIYH